MLVPIVPNATRAALTLARFVLLEARRTRLPLIVLCALATAIGLAGFLSQLALTESASLQAGVLAAFFRATGIFVCASFVVTSMVRESNDKGTELLLSLPISRIAYYAGKLLGFGVCGVLVAGIFSIVMLVWSPVLAVIAWFASLSLEIWMMVAVSLFFVVTLGDVVPALAASAGVYLLGRTVAAIQSISASPIGAEDDVMHRIAGWVIDALALALPPLDRATQTNWLLYAPPSAGELLNVAASLIVYGGLVTAAGLFDFHRRNL